MAKISYDANKVISAVISSLKRYGYVDYYKIKNAFGHHGDWSAVSFLAKNYKHLGLQRFRVKTIQGLGPFNAYADSKEDLSSSLRVVE